MLLTASQTQTEAEMIHKICVYCGSSAGHRASFLDAARALGQSLARARIDLVYGGASIGLMGAIADATLSAGGHVYGVIPTVLQRHEVMHPGLTELHRTESMHERKALMNELADGFIALPGGFGTLEELFEIITWAQLGIHAKPIGILNVEGYYEALLDFLQHAEHEGFLRAPLRQRLLVDSDPQRLIERLIAFDPIAEAPILSIDQS